MRRRFTRGTIVAAVAVGAAVVGGAALAGGAFDRKADRTAFLNDAAQQLGVTPDKLQQALLQAYDNRVDAWVAAGQITKEQGQALKDRAAQGGVPLNVSPRGPGFGDRGFGFGFGPWAGGAIGDVAKAVADYLGISQDTLMSDLQSGKTLEQIAEANGKTKDGVKQAIHDAAKTSLDQAVKDGKLTQTVENDVLSKLDANLDTLVTTSGPLKFGFQGRERHGGFGFRFGFHGAAGVDVLSTAATYIGISESDLQTALQSGKSLAQVAQDHGKTKDGLKQAIHDATKTSLDQAVKDGKLTQQVADQILAKTDSGLEMIVTSDGPFGRPHFRGGFGPPPGAPDDGSSGGSLTPPDALPVGSA
jgi:hypothetical protein